MRRAVAIAYGLAFAALCIPVAGKLLWGIPPENMLRDGVSVMEAPAYTGVISNLGLVLWGAAAAICLLMAAGGRGPRGLWAWAGGITLLLLADDGLLIHDNLLRNYTSVPEHLLYALYALLLLFYLWRYRETLWRGEPLLLALSFAWFAASLGVDALDGVVDIPALWLWEDGAKLFGIVSWLLFHARLAHAQARIPALVASRRLPRPGPAHFRFPATRRASG